MTGIVLDPCAAAPVSLMTWSMVPTPPAAEFDGRTVGCDPEPEGHHVWCPFFIGRREMSQALASQVLELALGEGRFLVPATLGSMSRGAIQPPSDR